ncbi:MAG: hypothetical protein KAV87_21715 [Desulfobacteraceae bacterium]|nr:hypothetical protein [Desulfobacteraceae bacterium]
MNSWERVKIALSSREPDRVPVIEIGISPAVISGSGLGCESYADFAEATGLDCVSNTIQFARLKSNADGSFVDEWECTYLPGAETFSHPIDGPISTMTDVENYEPPSSQAPHRLGVLSEHVAHFKAKKAIIFHCRVAFMWSVYLMGMDKLLMAMATEPELVRALFKKVAKANIEVIRRAARAGADIISLGDDYCSNKGPMMSPAMFREFVLPHLQMAVDAAHEEGALVIKHCDGNVWPILDMLVDTGIDGINPIDPIAGMKMAEVKKVYGSRVCLVGNIDCADLLSHGKIAEVEEAVHKCIEDGGQGGGLMVCSSNSIHSGVNPQNYLAMIRAVHKFGAYPLE